MASSILRLLSQTRVSKLLSISPPHLNSIRLFTSRTNLTLYFTDSEEPDDPTSPIKTTTVKINSPNYTNVVIKQPLPLPYSTNASSSRPTIAAEHGDPSDIAQVYNKVTTFEGFIKFWVRMMDHLTTEGYSQQVNELMADVKSGRASMIMALTGMLEEYADAGRTKDALIVFKKMESKKCNVNAYIYSVVIKALVKDKDPEFLSVVKECVMEMMGRGMQLNAGIYAVVFEGFVEKGKAEEGRELVEEMKHKGFVADEKPVREVLQGRRGDVVDKVIKILFGNS